MAKLHPQVQAALREGYEAAPKAANPHLWSSATFEAFEIGRALKNRCAAPSTVANPAIETRRGGWVEVGPERFKVEYRGASGGFYIRCQRLD